MPVQPAHPGILADLATALGIDRPVMTMMIREPKDGLIVASVEFPMEVADIERMKTVVARYNIRPVPVPDEPTA
ncbi:hypothetical protein B7486_68930 [cyanobacterium TDX16]|nr:hypothetical protein B7486_68930 [cyanobacterium TDX16]